VSETRRSPLSAPGARSDWSPYGVRIATRHEATSAETRRCLATSTASGVSPDRLQARDCCFFSGLARAGVIDRRG
jgi:hypothetical protein